MSSFTCYCSLLSTTLLQVLPSIDLFETKTRHILLDVTRNLRHLTIGNDFNESLLDITLPNSLQHGDGQRLFQFGLSAVPLPCCTHTHIYIYTCIHIQYWNMFFRCIIQQVWSNWDTIDTHTHIYIYTHTRIHFYVIWTLDIVSRHRYVHTFRYMYTYICVYIYMSIYYICIHDNNTHVPV